MSRGFTLIELMVVIGIAALVSAITLPVAFSLANGNKAMSCTTRMQQIGMALKQYALDNGAPPPYYPDTANSAMVGVGLLALVDGGYMKSTDSLHCPADSRHPKNDPLYSHSYDTADTQAAYDTANPYGDWNQYKFLSCRGVRRSSGDPQEKQQLSALPEAPSTSTVPAFRRDWHPDDRTLVLWCDFHYLSVTKGGKGVYQALFWDGSVLRMTGELFRSGTAVKTDAWRIEPADDPTQAG